MYILHIVLYFNPQGIFEFIPGYFHYECASSCLSMTLTEKHVHMRVFWVAHTKVCLRFRMCSCGYSSCSDQTPSKKPLTQGMVYFSSQFKAQQ